MLLVFHVFIAVVVLVYLVAIVVCGPHSCGHHGLWPSWFVAVMAQARYDVPVRRCLYGGQMSQRGEEFHQTFIVLEHDL